MKMCCHCSNFGYTGEEKLALCLHEKARFDVPGNWDQERVLACFLVDGSTKEGDPLLHSCAAMRAGICGLDAELFEAQS